MIDLDAIARTVADRSMVGAAGIAFTVARAVDAIAAGIPGALVECGVWRGGCAIAMLLAQRAAFGAVRRPVHMLDGFAGLPPAEPRDGPAALAWQADRAAPGYRDNCRASRAELEAALDGLGFAPGEYIIWAGPFAETLPLVVTVCTPPPSTGIALLRLDCDWYASVRPCLDQLVPCVAPGGTVIVDDYFAWDGCARAVHDHLAATDLPARIIALADRSAAYFVKPELS